MRAAIPLTAAILIAGGAVWYGARYQARSSAAGIALPVASAGSSTAGDSERARTAEPPPPPVTHPRGGIVLPIQGLRPEDIQDTFHQSRGNGERIHEATDILAPKGTPVHAMVDGTVKKLFRSKPGGITVYQYDAAEEFCYYYAHLDRYANGLQEGQRLRAGDVIGYVGVTGNSDPNAPHLHLAILRLGPEKKWWEGNTPVNPYPELLRLAR